MNLSQAYFDPFLLAAWLRRVSTVLPKQRAQRDASWWDHKHGTFEKVKFDLTDWELSASYQHAEAGSFGLASFAERLSCRDSGSYGEFSVIVHFKTVLEVSRLFSRNYVCLYTLQDQPLLLLDNGPSRTRFKLAG